MRIVIVYREASEHRMAVESFLRDYRFRTGHDIETLNPDTAEGARFCHLYDIVEYPSIIAIGPDGVMYQQWRGAQLPTISEVATVANV
ncbi:MAG: hypothetical protein Q4C83_02060 [Candidatus Saccharibacteria bacterium]|nr:hypothetical protein [Candidatus Saccharibacteria bacterium]